MSFFKDFKADFAQAVNELIPDSEEMTSEYDDDDMVNTFDEEPEKEKESKKSINSTKLFETFAKDEEDMISSEEDIEIAPEDLIDDIDDLEQTKEKQKSDSEESVDNVPSEELSQPEEVSQSEELDVHEDEQMSFDFLANVMNVTEVEQDVDAPSEQTDIEVKGEQEISNSSAETIQDDIVEEVVPEPEKVEENIVSEPEKVEENIVPEPEKVEENIVPESEKVEENIVPESEAVGENVVSDWTTDIEITSEGEVMTTESSVEDVKDNSVSDDMVDQESIAEQGMIASENTEVHPVVSEQEAESKEAEVEIRDIEEIQGADEDKEQLEYVDDTSESEDLSKDTDVDTFAQESEQVPEGISETTKDIERSENMKEEEAMIQVQEEKKGSEDGVAEYDDTTTYITKNTKITGDIETDGSIDVIGEIVGNVYCKGKMIAEGKIQGNVSANEIYANSARIEGDLSCEGSVKIGVGSVLIGKLEAESAVIAGAVNGDIDVHGPVIVDSTAVIMGNIKSKSVQINNGAVIEGFCSQCYSEIDVQSFFA